MRETEREKEGINIIKNRPIAPEPFLGQFITQELMNFLKPFVRPPLPFGTRAPGTTLDATTQAQLARRRKSERGAQTCVPPAL